MRVPAGGRAKQDSSPDLDALDEATLSRAAIIYLCSPANPQGAVADLAYLKKALALARQYNFLLVSDECYGELYGDVPPPGALEAAARTRRRAVEPDRLPDAVEALAARRACAPASRRDRPRRSRASTACAPTAARRRRRRFSTPPPRCGATRNMSRPTARSTAPSTTWPTSCWPAVSAIIGRPAASTCGSTSSTARRQPSACGRRPASRCCRAAMSHGPTRRGAISASRTSVSRSFTIWKPPRLH